MTKSNSRNDRGTRSSGGGQKNTNTQRPVKPSDNGGRSIYNDNGGRKSSDTTNSGGPREKA